MNFYIERVGPDHYVAKSDEAFGTPEGTWDEWMQVVAAMRNGQNVCISRRLAVDWGVISSPKNTRDEDEPLWVDNSELLFMCLLGAANRYKAATAPE